MFKIVIPETELFDSEKNEFIYVKKQELLLEHSLISISKWESKWKKPFLVKDPPKTRDETIDYVRCMTITRDVDPIVYKGLTRDVLSEINDYIEDPMTATWFSKDSKRGNQNGEAVTAELVYYWMVALRIPFECQKWHFNKLLTLIRVCDIKNSGGKKMSKMATRQQYRELNMARRKAMKTKG